MSDDIKAARLAGIRAEIESARGDLATSVAALADKADVKTQVRRRVDDARRRLLPWRRPKTPRAITSSLMTVLAAVVRWGPRFNR